MRISRMRVFRNKNQLSLFDRAKHKSTYFPTTYQADYLRRHYLLPVYMAKTVAELAGLGGAHE